MTKPRNKPSDPHEIAERRRFEREEADYIEARRAADPSIVVAKDARGAVVHAKRTGVFGLLLAHKAINQDQHNAVDRLWTDWATARHEADRSPLAGNSGGDATHGPLDRALAAQDRCALVAAHMGARAWGLMRDLIENEIVAAPADWRSIVRMFTGEEDPTAQTACVRWSCVELVSAYSEIDNAPPAERRRAVLAGGV